MRLVGVCSKCTGPVVIVDTGHASCPCGAFVIPKPFFAIAGKRR